MNQDNEQDANQIMDVLNSEWSNDMLKIKKRIAILTEENKRLKAEIEQLKNPDGNEDNAK